MKATDWFIIIIKNWTGGMLERGRVTTTIRHRKASDRN